ncbi:Uncharacterized protein OS=Rhodopirellula maiorica SM1 GN=RMSM_03289 PE=4 SV=1 [Gemmataceae bacterium]|nr:Uncharacterized protein OS=Rhodopirellula maiorica SM1 GN=RMSM_03289 PE=4 SV=1 [Gemmataceae bacterium]VTT96930.1 Uncharacterized protein OS=Rhodopirellula maiorica SM1 GN=RMSM_03289 PE=4 SV=1 [Gemmataceae bacterium]
MTRSAMALGVVVLALTRAGTAAAGPYDDLLKHTSQNTNTLVLIDVKGAFASPLAKAEKWAEKGKAGDRAGLGFVPADAELVVISAEVNLNSLDRDFQVGLVKVSHNVPEMAELAAQEGGTADEIAGRLAVLSPRNVYFTTLPGAQFVAVYPADRQYTARYLKAVKAGKTGQLSPYLAKAVEKTSGNAVTIAVDMEDVIDKTMLRLSLGASPSVRKVKTADVNLIAAFLSGTKGLTFAAKVDSEVKASFTVDFVGDPTAFRMTLPDLFRELLEDQGIAIAGFGNWTPTFTNNTMTLSGVMTTADLKRIISLFAFPQLPGEPDPKVKGNEAGPDATRRYLAAIDTILSETRAMQKSPNYDKMATWHDKAADQIDQLSRRNVDQIAADAAYKVSQQLRAIAQSMRGVPIDKKALESQQYYYTSGGGVNVGGFGWYGRPFFFNNPGYTTTNIPEIQAKIAKVVADDEKQRLESWSAIDRAIQEARRKLSDKYKSDF